MDFRGRKFGGLWQPVAACLDGMVLLNKISPGHGGLDPGVLESWMPGSWSRGGLQAWRLSVLLGGF